MKAFILTALCALTLVACKGNQNRQTPEPAPGPAETTEVQETVIPVPVPADSTGIAFECYKQIMARFDKPVDGECPEGVTLSYLDSMDDIEGYMSNGTYSCFPLVGGGWLCVYEHVEAAEGTPGFYNYASYTYKDGELADVEVLPVPALEELFDEASVDPGNKELVPKLKANFKERPRDFLTYWIDPFEQTVIPQLRPVDLESEEASGNWLEAYWEYRKDGDRLPVYHWNGKEFVK